MSVLKEKANVCERINEIIDKMKIHGSQGTLSYDELFVYLVTTIEYQQREIEAIKQRTTMLKF